MRTKFSLPHPAVHLLLYLVVPVTLNVVTAVHMNTLFPSGSTMVFRGSGLLFAVSWGWAGLVLCALLGLLFGLPIAGMQAAYLRSRIRRIERGGDVAAALRLDPWLGGTWPWLLAALVAYGVGWIWVFPPLGGPLMAVNVLWARTLVYHAELLIYEYHRANEELEREEEIALAETVRAPRVVAPAAK